MNKFKKSKFLILIFVLVLTTSGLLMTTYSTWLVTNTANLVSMVDGLVAKPFNFIAARKADLTDLLHTYKENELLKKSLYSLEEKSNQADSLKDENKQLRQLLEMKDIAANRTSLAADVIARTPASWRNELTVNAGSDKQVNANMLVVANGGLVGSVEQVASHSSRVNLLTNKENTDNISVSIKTGSKVVYGIITGYSEEKSAFIISQLNSADQIKNGDKVTTSGLGAYTAADIPVGEVSAMSEGDDHLTKKIYVKPSADLSDIRVVMLVGT
ncbi:rod shape-determining protein MreC [Streptococcus oricebi]|uniref:Cell shape-determining protein MreC n=1 Tax=Streptococcus oricebi TaxID=1547447 RepID=A0ABS5B5Z5_9STRE|nr:rod shape-determining protein MreC [Streptococcus oricebi]MBP2624264.1 rod shape-determining protein MreC [Streptococcus oricebi]